MMAPDFVIVDVDGRRQGPLSLGLNSTLTLTDRYGPFLRIEHKELFLEVHMIRRELPIRGELPDEQAIRLIRAIVIE